MRSSGPCPRCGCCCRQGARRSGRISPSRQLQRFLVTMRRVTTSSDMSSCYPGIISTFSIIFSCDTFVNTFTSSSLTTATQSALKYSVPKSQSSSMSFSGKQSLSVPSTYKITRSLSHYDGFLSNLFLFILSCRHSVVAKRTFG